MSAISVVMAVYNGRSFLREQVDSVVAELLPGDELIVIDDASIDGSMAVVRRQHSPMVRVYSNPTNLGVIASFERGLQLAANEFIFLCDQDDVWLAGRRAAFVDAFESDPAVLVVISDAQVIDAQGRMVAPSFMATRDGFDGSLVATVWRSRYLGCAMALRRPLLAAALPVPRQVPMHDMWFGAMARLTGKVVYLGAPLLQYRRHAGNVTPTCRQSLLTMFGWRVALVKALCIRMLTCKLGLHDRRRTMP